MGKSAAARAAAAEPTAAGVGSSERDVLLATKLNVPGLRPDLVPRPRLARRLEEGEGLVLACPQGYVRVFADEGPPMAALLRARELSLIRR
jgi:hypothetical protein